MTGNQRYLNRTEPIELEVSDIQIGAVEIKDSTTDDRVEVDVNNALKTKISNGGTDVSDSNPLPTTQQLKITAVIEEVAFDLNAAAFDETGSSTFDYIIDNVAFDFSTTEERTITITSDNGTKIFEGTSTNLNVLIASINFGQTANQTFRVQITQLTSAGTVDVTANIKNSPVALTADPSLAVGNNLIGKVNPVAIGNSNFELELAKGNLPGYSPVFLSATNSNITTTSTTVWEVGTDYTIPVNVDGLTFSSTNVNDTSTGTGAQLLLIQGLGADKNAQTEVIATNGTTTVISTLQWFFVNQVLILTAGSSLKNEGDIDFTYDDTGTVGARISTGDSISRMLMYRSPLNRIPFILDANLFLGKDQSIVQEVIVSQEGVSNAVFTTTKAPLYQANGMFLQRPPAILPAGSFLKVNVRKETVDGLDTISSIYQIYEVDPDFF